jgi:hypothetical protein
MVVVVVFCMAKLPASDTLAMMGWIGNETECLIPHEKRMQPGRSLVAPLILDLTS